MTAARKNSPLRERNLKQNQALGGGPSALIGWVETERRRDGDRDTKKHNNNNNNNNSDNNNRDMTSNNKSNNSRRSC